MNELFSAGQYIYESPDGGNTIYARQIGSIDRKLVGENVKQHKLYTKNRAHEELWYEIKAASEKNPALAEALERVKILYELSKEQ